MNKDFPEIMGYNKTSEAGMNLFATSIFLFGCNLRCPYCMNGRIVVVKPEDWDKPVKTVDLNIVKNHVLESKTQWVMISGGEPTFTPLNKLLNLIDEIKSWGCKVGMSTNGTRPEILSQILPKLDYVALDIKASSQSIYSSIDVKHKDESWDRLWKSKALLDAKKQQDSNFIYEVRTTLFPKYVTMQSITEIGKMLNSSEVWVLQQFRHAQNMLDEAEAKSIEPYAFEQVKSMAEEASKYAQKVIIRYV